MKLQSTTRNFLGVLLKGYPLYARKEKGDAKSTAKLGRVNERRIPVFAQRESYVSAWLNIQLSELAAQMSGHPMNDDKAATLSLVEDIAERPHMKLTFAQQPGDMLWVNNLAVMHRRDRYEDDPDPEKIRLLFRMWINFHDKRPLIAEHAALRQGIRGREPTIAGISA